MDVAKQDAMKTDETAPGAGMPHAPAPDDFAHRAAHWIHAHPGWNKSWTGYSVYQGIRGIASAIPYGVSMAFTLGGMEGLSRFGSKVAEAAPGTVKATFGSRLSQFAKFPAVRSSMMIATSFTLYRGTGKLVKWANESLFNPNDTEEQTADKVSHFGRDVWKKIKDNAPAGIASTPVAAFVLGFVNATFTKGDVPLQPLDKTKPLLTKDQIGKEISLDFNHANYKLAGEQGKRVELLTKTLTDKRGKFLEQAAIFTLGYSLFFELGDRLFKDKQVALGKWPGEPHSTNAAKPDDAPAHKEYGFFTNETSIGRFAFRRMVPTALAIFPYVAFKFRHSYMVLGDLAVKEGEGILKQMPKLTGIETKAVMWFTLIPFIAEKWEKTYDQFFTKLEKKAAGVESGPAIAASPAVQKEAVPAVEQLPQPLHKVAHITSHGTAVHAPVTQHLSA